MTALIIAIVVIVLLIALFIITFIINKRTPIPAECKNMYDSVRCDACSEALCPLNQHKEDSKEE